jgi:lipopolysaccharide transport system ATP-binding protein
LLLVQNVSKLYRLYKTPFDRHSRAESAAEGCPLHTDFWALRDISFSVERGEVVSLVGPERLRQEHAAAGRQRHSSADHRRVVTRGRMAALLELGAGFNPEFTRPRERLHQRRDHGHRPRRDVAQSAG